MIIIAAGLLDRIQADLWEIPKEIIQFSQHKEPYVVSIEDHFSKFKWGFLASNKEASIIGSLIELEFQTFHSPNMLQTDHGTKFINATLQKICGLVENMNGLISYSIRQSFIKIHER